MLGYRRATNVMKAPTSSDLRNERTPIIVLGDIITRQWRWNCTPKTSRRLRMCFPITTLSAAAAAGGSGRARNGWPAPAGWPMLPPGKRACPPPWAPRHPCESRSDRQSDAGGDRQQTSASVCLLWAVLAQTTVL